jgi:hypothetical protein
VEEEDVSASTDVANVPKPVAAGPEMNALARFYRDVTWTGTVHEGGMGPGTPAMTGAGRSKIASYRTGAGSSWIVSRTSSWRTAHSF